ncbi:MAG: hypothetical protein GIKADHBN_02296 [Phycisphaerales bacterium]|nr:hypothetical protein [Phycisphaerales bacterium]
MFGSSRSGRKARNVTRRSTSGHRASRSPSDLVRMDTLERRLVLSGAIFDVSPSHTDREIAGPISPVSLLEWAGDDFKVATGSWLVNFKDKTGGGDAADLAARQVATALGVAVKATAAVGRYCVEFTTTGRVTREAIDRVLAAMPNVKSIEPDRVYEKSLVPNDDRYTEQYAHDNTGTFLGSLGRLDADMDTTEAWDTTIGSRDQVVAVIDTGVQITHPDLADNIFVNAGEIAGNGIDDDNNGFIDDVSGWDFWDNENDPDDYEGHGTHVAGIIGAVGNNGIGVTGVNWAVSILPIRVLGPFGGTLSSIVAGIDYVTMLRENGVPIAAANASYGAPGSRLYEDLPEGLDAERDAIARFIEEGGTFVAAAGNASNDNDTINSSFFPSSYKIPGLISVASTDWDDRISGFSNYGAETVDLGAPGDLILSTYPTDSYAYLSGTSMAAPQVSGAVALMRSIKPTASAVEIRQTLLDSVDPLPDLQGKTVAGGRLNVARAIEIIGITGPVLKTLLPGPVTGQVDPSTNAPLKTITMRFNRPIDESKIDTTVFELRRDGADNQFGTGDDSLITVQSVDVLDSDPKQVTLTLSLNNQPGQRLPLDDYRLTIFDSVTGGKGLIDTDGNFLNGNSVSGSDEEYFFEVVPVSGTYEVNDSLVSATPVTFSASGTARFTGVTLGDGTQSALDVDIFRLDLARGGQITAEITAKRLVTGSNLDSYLRLFNANGVELTSNDQFFGQDSYIDYYVSTGGTYYVAVSGFGNEDYDPNAAGSGNSQSTGFYNLTVTASLNTDDLVVAEFDPETPLDIPANGTQGAIESQLVVTDTRQIIDANVQVRISHEFVSDLKITVVSPAGTQVVLYNRRGADGDQGINPTLFDDEAANSIADGSSPFAGAFRPEQALGAFDGQAAAGTWTLRVEDLSGGNVGQLLGWRIEFRVENDVFGDFEPNDTIPNAKDVAQITGNGYGSAAISAFLGDGGFGLLDRDFFKFSVNAGASMTAQTQTSTDTAIRLFNAQGQQLVLASDPASSSARIENFVFNDAGTYYLAVSSAANTAYNPYSVASGTAATETGSYTLSIDVTDGVSDGSLVLTGDDLTVGFGTNGLFYSGASGGTGIRFGGTEFLYDTSLPLDVPNMFFGGATDGTVFSNSRLGAAPQSVQLPFSLTDQSDAYNARGVGKALFNGGLRIERTLSMSRDQNFIAVDMIFTNEGSQTIGSLTWMEGIDPEMGTNLAPYNDETDNDITGRMATAGYTNNQFQSGLTIGLAAPAADDRATAMVLSPTIVQSLRDPTQLLAITPIDPDGASSDSYLSLVYDFGEVAAGQTISARYFIFLGNTPTAVSDMYAAVNNGTGAGHLTADPTSPANETLADGSSVPQLPYRYYFPEGFATPNTNTFIPILNPNDQQARVVVIARYETGVRDQVIAEFAGDSSIAANARSGVTITSPQLFAAGAQLVRPYEGYAVEVRSDRPLASTFSHYDTNLTATAASIGESFTTRVSDTWTFSQLSVGGTSRDFLIYYNTSTTTSKVEFTFYPEGGGPVKTYTQIVQGNRRLGLDVNQLTENELPRGENGAQARYGVKIVSQTPIVAVLSHYDTANRTAEGLNGLPNLGSSIGATSEGDLGRDSNAERFAILNATQQSAEVSLVFLFTSGSSYRTVVNVDAESQAVVEVGELDGFPVGQQYSLQYTSTGAVTVSLIADAFGDQLISGLTDRAYRYWGFGEGFKPRDGNPLVTETLRLYNPAPTDTIAEIVLRYDADLGTETLRVVVPARKAFAIDVHDLVTGSRRLTEVWYGLSIKAAAPIIASMTHADAYFPGAFSTLGTPLGDGTGL